MAKIKEFEIQTKFTDGTIEICMLNATDRSNALNKYLYIVYEVEKKINKFNELDEITIKEKNKQ